MKVAIWRAFQAIFDRKAAPVLEFAWRMAFAAGSLKDYIQSTAIPAWIRHALTVLTVVREIRKRVETLKVFPDRGTQLLELVDLGAGSTLDYRQLHGKPWRIVYFVSGRVANIMLIADGRRDMPALLMKRLVHP